MQYDFSQRAITKTDEILPEQLSRFLTDCFDLLHVKAPVARAETHIDNAVVHAIGHCQIRVRLNKRLHHLLDGRLARTAGANL